MLVCLDRLALFVTVVRHRVASAVTFFLHRKTKKEVDEKVETLPDRFIKALEDDITTLIPDSDPLASKLLVVFWALSL